jgi:hypothetical protein
VALNLADVERQLLAVAQMPRQQKIAAATRPPPQTLVRTREAAQLLTDATTSATGCLRAAELLCGDGLHAWEPETLWLTLDRQSIDLPVVNRDKLLAAITLGIVPAFWWEVHAFENTVLAFNSAVSIPETLQEATPAQMAWGVYEAELLFADVSEEKPEFDREPVLYVATVLHRAGYVRAPDLLKFAQRELSQLSRDGSGLTVAEIDAAWKNLKKQPLEERSLKETPLDTQLGRLASVELHIEEMLQRYRADLAKLR